MLKSTFTYDAFISYSHKDHEWVTTKLIAKLTFANIKYCIDLEHFKPGIAAQNTLLKIADDGKAERRIPVDRASKLASRVNGVAFEMASNAGTTPW